MKILHTSDWHLGHRLHEQSQHEEQFRFLNWLETYIHDHQVDVLLVSGDIFDTNVPSAQSQKLYYDFLISLKKTSCQQIIITGGNHDAPGTINAPRELLNALSIKVVGKATDLIKDEVFEININNEKIIVAAVPYLRDQDIRRAIVAESFEQISDRYKTALINHYTQVSDYCKTISNENTTIIAMGHLFAIGSMTSESEQTIYVGNLGDIGANDFPDTFDYVALGHLHRAQKIGGNDHIRYSGSPYLLSFSELNNDKKIIGIKIENGKIDFVKEIAVPKFREIRNIQGTFDECIAQLHALDREHHELTPWVEVVLNNTESASFGSTEIFKASEHLKLEVLKVSNKNDRTIAGLEKLIENTQHIKDLSPMEVFKLKCKERDFDLKANPEILDAFAEVLQIALDR